MRKFIVIIIQLILIILLFSFLINNNFIISFEIKDLIYSVSSEYIFISLLIIFIVVFLFQSIYFKSKYQFNKFLISNKIKKKEKGFSSFVNGMLALANKDFKKAISESKNVDNYLAESPSLSLLLKSEVYKIEKKYTELNNIYEEMIKNESTQNLGYRGLMEQYLRAQDYHHAFIYGEKLFNNNPYVDKIYETLVGILSKTNNWQQLVNISNKALSKRIIEKNICEENKSIAYFEISKVKRYSELKDSIYFIKQSLRLRKNFPPYIKLYLELLIQNKEYNTAKKFFRKSWSENPHPEYKQLLSSLAINLKIDISILTKFITSSNKNNYESKIVLVESLISDKKWVEARNHVKDLLDLQPKKEVCILMAKIEEGDTGDVQKVNAWNLRSKNGEDNKMWVCVITKANQKTWSSVSEGGYFNTLEWKKPLILNQFNDDLEMISHEN